MINIYYIPLIGLLFELMIKLIHFILKRSNLISKDNFILNRPCLNILYRGFIIMNRTIIIPIIWDTITLAFFMVYAGWYLLLSIIVYLVDRKDTLLPFNNFVDVILLLINAWIALYLIYLTKIIFDRFRSNDPT